MMTLYSRADDATLPSRAVRARREGARGAHRRGRPGAPAGRPHRPQPVPDACRRWSTATSSSTSPASSASTSTSAFRILARCPTRSRRRGRRRAWRCGASNRTGMRSRTALEPGTGADRRERERARKLLTESLLASEPLFRLRPWFMSDQFSQLDAAVAPDPVAAAALGNRPRGARGGRAVDRALRGAHLRPAVVPAQPERRRARTCARGSRLDP